jgi:hypothetical protein
MCGFQDINPIVCCPEDKIVDTLQNKFGGSNDECGIVDSYDVELGPGYEKKISKLISTSIILGMQYFLFSYCLIIKKQPIADGWPWVARLGFNSSSSPKIQWLCEGAIISNKYLVTSAHCAIDPTLSLLV